MKWTVEQLKRRKNEPFVIDGTVTVDDLKKTDPQIRDISPVHVQGEAMIKEDFASFQLQITGKMILPCSVTLEDVDYPFSIDTVETFQFDQWPTGDESLGNEEVHLVCDNQVDLLPVIKANILVSIPMKVKGPNADIKPSGTGWEVITEEEQKNRIDPRMAKLATLFNHNGDEKKE